MTRWRRTLAALALGLLLGCGADPSSPGGGDASTCAAGALRVCQGCAVGALRTNLRGVQRCALGPDGVAVWGACECAGDGGP